MFSGLGGWADGFLSEGYDVIGFDIEARPYPGRLVLQDVLTLHGAQFRNAAVIVASPRNAADMGSVIGGLTGQVPQGLPLQSALVTATVSTPVKPPHRPVQSVAANATEALSMLSPSAMTN